MLKSSSSSYTLTKGKISWWSFENINQSIQLPAQILQLLLITFRTKSSSPWSAKLCGVTSGSLHPQLLSAQAPPVLLSAGVLAVPSTCDACSWPHNLFTCSFLYLEQNFPRYLHDLVPHFMQNLAHLSFHSPPSIKNRLLHTLSLFLLLLHFIILITIWHSIIHSCLCILSFLWQK